MRIKTLIYSIFIFSALFLYEDSGSSYVLVHDDIAIKGEKIFLRAEVGGRFFKKGGEIVEFFSNKKLIGKRLSGGDGVAFMEFLPSKTGIYKIYARVSSSKDEGEGTLLSLDKGAFIILIGVEGGLYKNMFTREPVMNSLECVKKLSKRYPIVYVYSGFVNISDVKSWLKRYSYPEYPVMDVRNGLLISEIHEKGLKIKAVIGNDELVELAKEHNLRAFTFGYSDYAREVSDWNELLKRLK
jgi:hypothetical protein